MDTLKPFLDAIGVEPWMYPVLMAFGIVHQFMKGTMRSWGPALSIVSAGALAVTFGGASWMEHALTPLAGVSRIIILFAAALVTEKGAETLADKLPFIPKNNEWAKKPEPINPEDTK